MSASIPPINAEGAWVRATRHERGLHQHQLAAKIDKNPGRISEIETGAKIWTPELRQMIEDALGAQFPGDPQ